MELRPMIYTVLRLFFVSVTLECIAILTKLTFFSWIAVITAVLMFLNLYWLGICCIAYWSAREDKSNGQLSEDA